MSGETAEKIAEEFIESEFVKPSGESFIKRKVIHLIREAYERGQVAMREKCAACLDEKDKTDKLMRGFFANELAQEIRALPTSSEEQARKAPTAAVLVVMEDDQEANYPVAVLRSLAEWDAFKEKYEPKPGTDRFTGPRPLYSCYAFNVGDVSLNLMGQPSCPQSSEKKGGDDE